MSKPLKDWTLGEVQAECKSRRGSACKDGCKFANLCNDIGTFPDYWDLSDPIHLTPDELAVCRLLKAGGGQKVWLTGETPEISIGPFLVNGVLPKLLFPSLRPGDTLDLATMSLDPPQ